MIRVSVPVTALELAATIAAVEVPLNAEIVTEKEVPPLLRINLVAFVPLKVTVADTCPRPRIFPNKVVPPVMAMPLEELGLFKFKIPPPIVTLLVKVLVALSVAVPVKVGARINPPPPLHGAVWAKTPLPSRVMLLVPPTMVPRVSRVYPPEGLVILKVGLPTKVVGL